VSCQSSLHLDIYTRLALALTALSRQDGHGFPLSHRGEQTVFHDREPDVTPGLSRPHHAVDVECDLLGQMA
jgi:hypothetical protein